MSAIIAIIGGGYSGAVLAVNLLRRCRDTRIALIERAGRIGRGIAYAERDIPYLLNVPAKRASADSRAPLQFLEFARASLPAAGPEDYLPRALYGRYVEALLAQAEREAGSGTYLERLQDEALDLAPGPGSGYTVHLRHHPPLVASRVVLAVGVPLGLPASWTHGLDGHPAFHTDALTLPAGLDARHTALILGNGLTMADAAVTLSWQRSAVPMLHTLSRRGVVSLPQLEIEPPVAPCTERLLGSASSVRRLLRSSREYAAELQAGGGDWREVVALIRLLLPRLWPALPPVEKRRFLRHLRVYWDAHRHRLPPPVAARLEELKDAGRLKVHAGRVLSATARGDRIRVQWAARGGGQPPILEVDALVLATGPEATLSRSPEGLVTSLRRRNLIAADALDLGLRAGANGECLDAAGAPQRNLFYLGPMQRAQYWEAIATFELRDLAENLALHLCTDRDQPAQSRARC